MGVMTMTSWYSNLLMHYEGLLLNTIIAFQLKSAVSFLHYVLCLNDVLVDLSLQRQRGATRKPIQRVDEPLAAFSGLTCRMAAGGYSGMGENGSKCWPCMLS